MKQYYHHHWRVIQRMTPRKERGEGWRRSRWWRLEEHGGKRGGKPKRLIPQMKRFELYGSITSDLFPVN